MQTIQLWKLPFINNMFKQKGSIVLISLLVGGILTLFGLGYYVSNEQKNINLSASSADLFKISSDNLTPVKNTWGIVVSSGEDVCITGGNCLSTGGGGTYNYTSSWEQLFTNAITPTSTTAGIFVNASSTFNSTLRVNSGLIVNSNATTTGNSLIGNTLYVKDSNVGIGTANPNSKLEIYNSAGAGTITMSGNGSDAYNFDSMTMYDTGGKYWAIHHRNTDGGLNNLLFEHYNGSTYNGYMTINPDGHILTPNLRAASLNASSTNIGTLKVFNNATTTGNQYVSGETSLLSRVGIGIDAPSDTSSAMLKVVHNWAGASAIQLLNNNALGQTYLLMGEETSNKKMSIGYINTNIDYGEGYELYDGNSAVIDTGKDSLGLNVINERTSAYFNFAIGGYATANKVFGMTASHSVFYNAARMTTLNATTTKTDNLTVNTGATLSRATSSAFVIGSDGAAGSKKGCLAIMSSSATWTYIYYNGTTQVISASSCADTGGNSTTTMIVGQ
jgi:hypothetical protein